MRRLNAIKPNFSSIHLCNSYGAPTLCQALWKESGFAIIPDMLELTV